MRSTLTAPHLSSSPILRATVAAACLWEAAQIVSNGPYTWSAGVRLFRGTKAGRAALTGLCGLLWFHLVIESDS